MNTRALRLISHPNEQVPVGHVPVGQKEEPSLPLATEVLNADNCFFDFDAPHLGHFGAGSELRRAKCSKFFPQLSHLYSYIGIVHSFSFFG